LNGTSPHSLVVDGVARAPRAGDRHGTGARCASPHVGSREVVALLGRPGSRKSALLAVCGGLDRQDQGDVTISGRDLAALDDAERRTLLQREVGWMFQSPMLVPMLTAAENVAIAMRIAGERPADAERMTMAALEAVGLEHRAGRPAEQLSRGEGQRVALARALVKAPALVIADEPTAELDPASAGDIVSLLRDAARTEVAVLFRTHDEAEAARADRILVIDRGVVRESSR
jgi:putative ABC transport system ATP-binding protein